MSPKLPVLTPKKLVRALKRGGFLFQHQTGSHRYYIHPDRPGSSSAQAAEESRPVQRLATISTVNMCSTRLRLAPLRPAIRRPSPNGLVELYGKDLARLFPHGKGSIASGLILKSCWPAGVA